MNKTLIKYAAVGVAGYLIGFYEMKYKVVKAMAIGAMEKKEKFSEDPKDKEES